MKSLLPKTNLSPVTKITLAALFTALAVVLQKVLAINYIPVVPFLRISLGGPAMIIFSALLLGPIYGLFVGLASDLLGYLIFDPKTFPLMPQITAIYALLGLAAYFVFAIIKNMKNRKVTYGIMMGFSLLSIVGIEIYLLLNDKLKLYGSTYDVNLAMKIAVPAIMLTLAAVMFTFIVIMDKKQKVHIKGGLSYPQISFSLLILEILVMVIFGTLMKGWAFGFATYPVILICQIVTLFVNVPLSTVLVSLMQRLFIKHYEVEE